MKNTYVMCASWSWEDKLLYIKACIGDAIPHNKICGYVALSKDELLSLYRGAWYIYCCDNGMIVYDGQTNNPAIGGRVEVKLSELKKESDYDKGMRKAMQKIAVSCGRVFGADVGYEDLPDLVKSIVRSNKETAKTKPTKFVKVEESIFDLKEEFERGELFTKKACGEYVLIEGETHLALLYEMQSHENSKVGIYRQVEIDWRDEMAEFTGLGKDFDAWVNCIDDMYDFDFVEMCHKVAELTDKPE